MTKYAGKYVCPYCKEEFLWEYIDDGFRQWKQKPFVGDVIEPACDAFVAVCKRSKACDAEYKALSCYCPRCQTALEIEDIDDTLKALF